MLIFDENVLTGMPRQADSSLAATNPTLRQGAVLALLWGRRRYGPGPSKLTRSPPATLRAVTYGEALIWGPGRSVAVTRRLPANMHSTSSQHPGNIQASSDQHPFNILNVISTGGFTCRASRCCRFCLVLLFAHACSVVCMRCRVRECALLVCVPVCVSKQQCGNHTANDLRINHGRKHSNTSTRVPVSAKKRWDKQN